MRSLTAKKILIVQVLISKLIKNHTGIIPDKLIVIVILLHRLSFFVHLVGSSGHLYSPFPHFSARFH